MFVRHTLFILMAGAALLAGAGCSGRGGAAAPDETTDSVFRKAHTLKLQGRNGEAVLAYEQVIERRGESGAPESHLEAGNLYLRQLKDPIRAYHHFGRYLDLQPASPRAGMVKDQRDAAQREAARILLAPQGYAAGGMDRQEVERLKDRIQELEAEIRMLQGVSSTPVMKAPPMIAIAADAPEPTVAPPIIPFPNAPAEQSEPATASGSTFTLPSGPVAQVESQPRRPLPQAAPVQERPTPQRPPTTPAATTTSGRRHTVAPGQSLWQIGRIYYRDANSTAKVRGIFEANRDQMRNEQDLKAGMVLRIP